VKRMAMFITSDGEPVLPGSREFFQALGDPAPDYDAEAYAVRNHGFIKVTVIEQSICEIEVHPRTVTLPALLGVQQMIQSCGVNLFRIKHLDKTWLSEITSSAERAMSRLAELSAPQLVVGPRDRYTVEPLDYAKLLDDENNPLRPMAQKWRAAFGQFDATVISFAINYNLLSQMVIIGIRPQQPEPVWRFIGDAHSSWLDRRHHQTMLGEKIENIPDKEYAVWAAEFYKHVASTGQPRFDCVAASIESATGPYFTRYERLVLPWRTTSDEVLVTVSPRRLSSGAISDADAPSANDPADRKLARSS
jgi:hypothetical protein